MKTRNANRSRSAAKPGSRSAVIAKISANPVAVKQFGIRLVWRSVSAAVKSTDSKTAASAACVPERTESARNGASAPETTAAATVRRPADGSPELSRAESRSSAAPTSTPSSTIAAIDELVNTEKQTRSPTSRSGSVTISRCAGAAY